MDERTTRALRDWQRDPGDREAFDEWWGLALRPGDFTELELRVAASGLFDPVPERSDKIQRFRHRQTGIVMVVADGTRDPANVTINGEPVPVRFCRPYLIAEEQVTDSEWERKADHPSRARVSVGWSQAAGWLSQTSLVMPTAMMWLYAQRLIQVGSLDEFLQDRRDIVSVGDTSPEPLNGFKALGDDEFNTPLWTTGSMADLTFAGLNHAHDVGDDPDQLVDRLSMYGLNARVLPFETDGSTAVDKVVTRDLQGNERTLQVRANPFGGGPWGPNPCGSTEEKMRDLEPSDPTWSFTSGAPDFPEEFDALRASQAAMHDLDQLGADVEDIYFTDQDPAGRLFGRLGPYTTSFGRSALGNTMGLRPAWS